MARRLDWARVCRELEEARGKPQLAEYASKAIAIIEAVGSRFSRAEMDFDPSVYRVIHHDELPGGESPRDTFEHHSVATEFLRFKENPEVHRAARLIAERPGGYDAVMGDPTRRELSLAYAKRIASVIIGGDVEIPNLPDTPANRLRPDAQSARS